MPQRAKNATATQLASDVKGLSKKLDKLTVGTPKSSKNKRKRANRRARGSLPDSSNGVMSWGPTEMIMSQAADTGLRRLRRVPAAGLTNEGVCFLKCAFAPPDFAGESPKGVPDEFRGFSLTQKHRLVQPVVLTTAFDYYYFLLPTPGYAYGLVVKPVGVDLTQADVVSLTPYADFQSFFGSTQGTTGNNVTKYRFVSNHIEMIPTVNQMQWTGTIQCWRIPVRELTRSAPELASGVLSNIVSVTGLQGAQTASAAYVNQYSGPFIMGCYAGAYNTNCTFEFNSIMENIPNLPTNLVPGVDFMQLDPLGTTDGFTGIDANFDTVVIKISGVTSNESMLLKTWACVEYVALPNTVLYGFQSLGITDMVAINLYREIINGLPIAVPFTDNESFWRRVAEMIRQISGITAFIPGPIGLASRGVNMLSSAALTAF